MTGYSVSSVYRAFRRYRNCTPLQFLAQVRMDMVRRHLLEAAPGSTVKHIALACGSGEPTDFFSLVNTLGCFKIEKITLTEKKQETKETATE